MRLKHTKTSEEIRHRFCSADDGSDLGGGGGGDDFNLDTAFADTAKEMGLGGGEPAAPDAGGTGSPSLSSKPGEGGTGSPASGAPTEGEIIAPKSWKAEISATHWQSLPAEVKQEVLRREKEILDGITTYKEDATFGKRDKEVLTEFDPHLKRLNIDPATAVQNTLRSYVGFMMAPPEQKAAAFGQIASQLGLSPKELADHFQAQATQAPIDPNIKVLSDKLDRVLSVEEQRQVEARKTEVARGVDEFAKDKPYFDQCANEIVYLIQTGLPLEEAYDRAIWLNPVTRKQLQDEHSKTLEAELRTRLLEEARKVGGVSLPNLKPAAVEGEPTAPLGTLDETMKETLSTIRKRA